jgi:hypothetical protein
MWHNISRLGSSITSVQRIRRKNIQQGPIWYPKSQLYSVLGFNMWEGLTGPITWTLMDSLRPGPRIIYSRIGSSPPERKPLAWLQRPLSQSRTKKWHARWVMWIIRPAYQHFTRLCVSNCYEKYQAKGSRSFYTKHREVTGAGLSTEMFLCSIGYNYPTEVRHSLQSQSWEVAVEEFLAQVAWWYPLLNVSSWWKGRWQALSGGVLQPSLPGMSHHCK